jgi:hypothetical protein
VEIAILTLLIMNTLTDLAIAGFFIIKRKTKTITAVDKKDKDYETMKKWLVARGDPNDRL